MAPRCRMGSFQPYSLSVVNAMGYLFRYSWAVVLLSFRSAGCVGVETRTLQLTRIHT